MVKQATQAEKNPNDVTGIALPYMNNIKIIGITIVINLVLASLFNFYKESITLSDLLIDSAIGGMVTAFINVFYVNYIIQQARKKGWKPDQVPVSQLIMLLPRFPPLLGLIYGLIFGTIMTLISYVIFTFYQFATWNFYQFMVYKLIYSTLLSGRILNYAIFRLVQPDVFKSKKGRDVNEPSRY